MYNSANLGGAIFKFQLNALSSENGVTIVKSNFSSNDAFVGAAIYVGSFDDTYSQRTFSFNLSGVMVRHNRCDKCSTTPDKDIQGAAIYTNQVSNVDVRESKFCFNSPKGAIEIRGGKLHFYGTIIFEGNEGDAGGAVSLSQNSKLYFHDNCYVKFINNTATRVGGAIYIDGDSVVSKQSYTLSNRISNNIQIASNVSYSYCSIQFIGTNAHTIFRNNTAKEAGNSVYATPIYKCWQMQEYSPSSLDYYLQRFDILEQNEIASFPVNVTVNCGQETNCSRDGEKLSITSYPGKVIRLSARTIDLANTTSPSLVYATVNPEKVKLGKQEYVTWVNTNNFTLEYSFYGPQNTTFELLLSTSRGNVPTVVTVTLQLCGLGFSYIAAKNSCECSKLYEKKSVSCNISDGKLSRNKPSLWLGKYDLNFKTELALVEVCPLMYCNDTLQVLTSEDLRYDTICVGNRTGILCGQCKKNLSLGFGSSKCCQCTNAGPATVLLYAVIGLFIVFIIFVLNLTVTQGTLYGLIFYANVVIVNRDVLLSDEMQRAWVFFYMISLDLGFIGEPLCFLANMNQATKTGLQFVFPFYLIIIVISVFLICKYCCSYTTGIEHGSMKGLLNSVGQFIGGRVTSVIATLLYLSYSSLCRTVIEILSFATIEIDGGVKVKVWLYDGSIDYGKNEHAWLLVVAVLVSLLLLLYTGILILMPLADLFSGHSKTLLCISSAFNRHLKPFADAYYSPFKSKWRVWLGIRLWVIVILYIITAFAASDKPALVFWLHSIIMAALISLQAFIKPLCKPCTNDDKGWVYNYLDLFYMINYLMIVLCAWYYNGFPSNNKPAGGLKLIDKDILIILLLVLAMVALVLTVVYHVMLKTNSKLAVCTLRRTGLFGSRKKPSAATVEDSQSLAILREPLMEEVF